MKTVVINAGPKRKDINAEVARSAFKGAESGGSEVKYIDLYKLDLRGCMTCLICKKEGYEGRCYWRDEVSFLIEEILNSDCLIIAVPIFFSAPASHYQALIERLIYCIVSYETGNSFKGKVNVGLFYTINYPKDYFEEYVRPHLKQSEDILNMLNGEVVISSFENISKRQYSNTSPEGLETINEKEKHLSLDLKKAFDIAFNLVKTNDDGF